MVRYFLLYCACATLVGCGSSSSGAPAGPVDPPGELGSFAVGHSTFVAVDRARGGRSLPVDVWYPVDAGDDENARPRQYILAGFLGPTSDVALADPPVSARTGQTLLVFSHGYGGIGTQSVFLMEALASHGFIVASPEHIGNSQSTPPEETDDFDEAAAKRVPDVSFIIDTMVERSADPEDPFHGRIDPARVGVLGNSFGAMTAIGMASGWAGASADPRVAAILPVSAVIVKELQVDTRTSPNAGFTPEQLARIRVPVMLMGGTEDVNVFPENNEIAFAQLVSSPRVYKVDIIGATHTHFANICSIGDSLISRGFDQEVWPNLGAEELVPLYEITCGPDAFPIEESNRLANMYSVAFFKRHLLGQAGYEEFLTAEFADTESAIDFVRR